MARWEGFYLIPAFLQYICCFFILKHANGASASKKMASILPFTRPSLSSTTGYTHNTVTLDFNNKISLNESRMQALFKTNKPVVTLLGSNGGKKSNIIHSIFDLPFKQQNFILIGTSPRISFSTSSNCLLMDIEVPFDALPVFSSILNKPGYEDDSLATVSSTGSESRSTQTNYMQTSLTSPVQPLTAKDILTRAAKTSPLIIFPVEERELFIDSSKAKSMSISNAVLPDLLHRSLSVIISTYKNMLLNEPTSFKHPLHLVAILLESEESSFSEECIKENLLASLHLASLPSDSPPIILTILKLDSYNKNLENIKQKVQEIVSKQDALFSGKLETMFPSFSTFSPLDISSEFHTFSQIRDDTFCEEIHATILQHVNKFITPWQQSLDRGEKIAHLGRLVDIAYSYYTDMYEMNTLAAMGSHVREKIRDRLILNLQDIFRTLFIRQLILLEREGRRQLRLQLLHKTKPGELPDVITKEKIIREIMDNLNIGIEEMRARTSASLSSTIFEVFSRNYKEALKEQAENFDSTPLAQLQIQGNLKTDSDLLQAVQTQESQKQKKQRGIKMGLGLTAMLRQSGYGNLQGFANYAGGPITLTFGYANDRDSPESLQNGRKPPIFRIQPKFQFDITV